MTHSRPWPAELTKIAGRRIRHFRENRTGGKMSAQQLADAMTSLGLPYTRAQVTNLEAEDRRRDTITVGELVAFAAVLGVPPALLLFPIGSDEQLPILPGLSTDAWDAYKAFVGDDVISYDVERAGGDGAGYAFQAPGRESPIWAYRQHDSAHAAYVSGYGHEAPEPNRTRITQAQLTRLAAARIGMHQNGWTLPTIMPSTIEALAETLLAWGFRQDSAGNLEEAPSLTRDMTPNEHAQLLAETARRTGLPFEVQASEDGDAS